MITIFLPIKETSVYLNLAHISLVSAASFHNVQHLFIYSQRSQAKVTAMGGKIMINSAQIVKADIARFETECFT
ncbi:MAG TPA: hypothetical protein VFI95_04910 [Terriglobales bacterium]|nr:hypothetical protein [Terriglobales bacterium]